MSKIEFIQSGSKFPFFSKIKNYNALNYELDLKEKKRLNSVERINTKLMKWFYFLLL